MLSSEVKPAPTVHFKQLSKGINGLWYKDKFNNNVYAMNGNIVAEETSQFYP
jgi:hypothetical protein